MTARYERLDQIESLVARFLDCSLPRGLWTHHAHLTVGLWVLRDRTLDEALNVVRAGILRYNAACGVKNTSDGGYHETITRFYMHVIGRFLADQPDRRDWVSLTNRLLESCGDRDLPFRHYTRERLMSRAARADWVPPDLEPLD